MTSRLSDEELLQYLMTSDFNENLKPEEYRFLLIKFRNFYKIMYGRKNLEQQTLKTQIETLQDNKDTSSEEIKALKRENASLKDEIDINLKPRKLTFKERWNGKIERLKNT